MPTKYCTGCDQKRNIEDFNWKNRNAGIRQSKCRHCAAANNKVHYQRNKQAYLNRAYKHNGRIYKENIQYLHEYLSIHPCIDCGCNDIRVLEFDHVRGEKKADVTRLLLDGYSWAAILAEIAKCEVRCANCHRIKTLERGNWWRHQQEQNKNSAPTAL